MPLGGSKQPLQEGVPASQAPIPLPVADDALGSPAEGAWKQPGRPLDAFDRALIAEYVRNPAVKDLALAQYFGVGRKKVMERKKNPRFQQMLDAIMLPAKEVLKRAAPDAARYLHRVVREDRPQATKAAMGILRHVVPVQVEQGINDEFKDFMTAMRSITDPEEKRVAKTRKPKQDNE